MLVELSDQEREIIKNNLMRTPTLPMEWEGIVKPIVIKMDARPSPEPTPEPVSPVEQ